MTRDPTRVKVPHGRARQEVARRAPGEAGLARWPDDGAGALCAGSRPSCRLSRRAWWLLAVSAPVPCPRNCSAV